MVSSGMFRRVAVVRTDISEELSASIIRMTRIVELGATLAVTSNCSMLCWLLVTANIVPSSPILVTLMMEAVSSSETSVLTRATWHNIPENGILHSYRHENLKSYIYIHSVTPNHSHSYDMTVFTSTYKSALQLHGIQPSSAPTDTFWGSVSKAAMTSFLTIQYNITVSVQLVRFCVDIEVLPVQP
jgi:hypothetical protein